MPLLDILGEGADRLARITDATLMGKEGERHGLKELDE